MKKTLAPIMLFLLPTVLPAQEVGVPMLEEGKSWAVHSWSYAHNETSTDILLGDTAIAGKTYKKVYSANAEDLSDLQQRGIFFREEADGKIYYITSQATSETLWFDFGARPGDSWVSDRRRYVVTAVGEETVDYATNGKAICHYFDYYLPEGDSFTLFASARILSGIGSESTGMTTPLTYEITGNATELLCCHNGKGVTLYSRGSCYKGTDGISQTQSDASGLNLHFHTTACGKLTMEWAPDGPFSFSLYDASGRLANSTVTAATSHSLTIENLVSGVYVYRFVHNGREVATGKVLVR